MIEIWKDIPGYEGAYQVSDHGRVRSLDRVVVRVDGIERYYEGQIKKGTVGKKGYRQTSLSDGNGDEKGFRFHALVLLAFVGPKPANHEIRHLDGKPENNNLSNLAYGTPSENAADRKLHGRLRKGVTCHFSKLEEDDVRAIRVLARRGMPQAEIGFLFGLGQAAVWAIVTRKSWAHV